MRVRRRHSEPAASSAVPASAVLERHVSERVRLRYLEAADEEEFLALVRDSRSLHRPWAYPPERSDQFQDMLVRCRRDDSLCIVAEDRETGAIAGIFTVSQIVRGAFQSAFLGYYAAASHAGRGYMR